MLILALMLVFVFILLIITYMLCIIHTEWKPVYVSDVPHYLSSLGFEPIKTEEIAYCASGIDVFNSLISDIRNAKQSITLSFYTIKPCTYSKQLEDELRHAKMRGVKLNVILDAMGSYNFISNSKLGNIVKYNPFGLTNKYFVYRDHDKYVMIDDSILYLASFVIRESSISTWIESGIRVVGDFKSRNIDEEFTASLKRECFITPDMFIPFWCSGKQHMGLYADVYLNCINNAKSKIYIITPYFVPPDEIIDALVRKTNEGCDVNILCLSKSDHPIIGVASEALAGDMLQRTNKRINFYRYPHTHVHSKIMLVDDDIVIFGSGNFDYRSLFQMHETGAYVKNKYLYNEIYTQLMELLSKSNRVKVRKNILKLKLLSSQMLRSLL